MFFIIDTRFSSVYQVTYLIKNAPKGEGLKELFVLLGSYIKYIFNMIPVNITCRSITIQCNFGFHTQMLYVSIPHSRITSGFNDTGSSLFIKTTQPSIICGISKLKCLCIRFGIRTQNLEVVKEFKHDTPNL